MNDYQTRCMHLAQRFAGGKGLERAGRRVRAGCLRAMTHGVTHTNWSAGLGLALLSEPGWGMPEGPAAGALRRLALDYMDRWARFLVKASRPGTMPADFEMIGFGPAYEVLAPAGSARQVGPWRDAMARAAEATAAFLLKKEAAWGKPGPYTGTGPNHLFLLGGSLYRFGRLLGDARLAGVARRAMRALCRLQASEGYFPENVGPAVLYHRVSLFGLCDYAAASADPQVVPYLAPGIDFVVRSAYPDLSPVETFDQRNRTGVRAGRPGQALCTWSLGFGRTPAGRRQARLMLERAAERLDRSSAGVSQAFFGMAAMGAWMDAGGTAARLLPCERPARADLFDGRAAILRRDGWCVVLSGYTESNRPGNPFILDRTQAVSIFQDRAGLVIGGGNDKNHLEAATFDLRESGYVCYFPPLAGQVRASGRRGVLDLDYGAAQARLAVTIRSPREVELTAGAVTNFGDQVDRFNLQLPVGPGTTVVIDGRPVTLSARSAKPRTRPVRRTLEVAGVRLEPTGGAEFVWPHLPWNSYQMTDHTSTIGAATGFLRLTLTGRDLAERTVRIQAGPQDG